MQFYFGWTIKRYEKVEEKIKGQYMILEVVHLIIDKSIS